MKIKKFTEMVLLIIMKKTQKTEDGNDASILSAVELVADKPKLS